MTRLQGEFEFEAPLDDAAVACVEALEQLGWPLQSVEATRIVSSTETPSNHGLALIEIELTITDDGTDVRIVGSDTPDSQVEPFELTEELDRLTEAIAEAAERIETASYDDAPATAET